MLWTRVTFRNGKKELQTFHWPKISYVRLFELPDQYVFQGLFDLAFGMMRYNLILSISGKLGVYRVEKVNWDGVNYTVELANGIALARLFVKSLPSDLYESMGFRLDYAAFRKSWGAE